MMIGAENEGHLEKWRAAYRTQYKRANQAHDALRSTRESLYRSRQWTATWFLVAMVFAFVAIVAVYEVP